MTNTALIEVNRSISQLESIETIDHERRETHVI